MSKIDEIRERHEIEAALDESSQYSEWSQPALAGRLRQSNTDRSYLLGVIDRIEAKCKEWDGLSDMYESQYAAGICSDEIHEIINEE